MNLVKIIYFFFLTAAMVFVLPQSYAQIPYVNNSCFCIEEANAQPNILYEYEVDDQEWQEMAAITYYGPIAQQAEKIEAMAINAVDGVIYAFDNDRFGTIEIGTTEFKLKNTGLQGTGKIKGNVVSNYTFGDVDGLAFDLYTRELWATNRMSGSNTNDLLFKIDPETGQVIKGVFAGGHDFVEIEESYDGTVGGPAYDVEGIAVNPFTGQLFAIQNQNGPGVVTEVDKFDGRIESRIFDLSEDDIEGFGFSGYGYLYGTTGDSSDVPSSLIAINFVNLSTQGLASIDPTLPNGIGDFESFDCLSDYVDLALTAKTVANNQTIFSAGDIVDINVTIYNQGTIDVNNLEITMHLPTSMSIVGSGWTNIGGIKRNRIINQTIPDGTNYTFQVKLKLNTPTSSIYNVPFEISKANNNVINTGQGYVISLPDVDSTPDTENQETNIANNQINENGKFSSEDEDDHDVANFKTDKICPLNMTLSYLNQTMYTAGNSIQTYGEVDYGDLVEMYAGQEIVFDIGFEIEEGAEFTADIQNCP